MLRLLRKPTHTAVSRTYFSSTIPPNATPRFRPSFFSQRISPSPIWRARLYSTKPQPPQQSQQPPTTLSARLKQLSREYGYAALGVYLGLSLLDFPFCFLAVRYLGTERIGHLEERFLAWLRGIKNRIMGSEPAVAVIGGDPQQGQTYGESELEIAEEKVKREGASIWTELALAYAIHKSFIFVRVPLTAAVTPKVVKVLRGWGWDIGRKQVGLRPKLTKGKK
ncbi:hypothetical protein BDZ91DRAFT_660680 [Kalaharituber pfeilii]|nr:hypothetical protein BDZ91DRAFT_660680 [Kalaharituber pfeilii]